MHSITKDVQCAQIEWSGCDVRRVRHVWDVWGAQRVWDGVDGHVWPGLSARPALPSLSARPALPGRPAQPGLPARLRNKGK
eukprot:gene18755-biopygen6938